MGVASAAAAAVAAAVALAVAFPTELEEDVEAASSWRPLRLPLLLLFLAAAASWQCATDVSDCARPILGPTCKGTGSGFGFGVLTLCSA